MAVFSEKEFLEWMSAALILGTIGGFIGMLLWYGVCGENGGVNDSLNVSLVDACVAGCGLVEYPSFNMSNESMVDLRVSLFEKCSLECGDRFG